MAVLTREAPPDGHVFEDIADAMPHMVWLAGPDGGTTYHNRRILEYAGLTAGITLGTGWERLVHPDDVPVARATWLHCVGAGEPFEAEYRLRRHDGAYRRFLARANPQRDGRGGVVRWVGTSTDVEDLKRAQAEAAGRRAGLETESLLEAVVESSEDAVIAKSLDGTITGWNPAAERMFGYSAAEAIGRSIDMLVPPEHLGEMRDGLARVARGEGVEHRETVRVRKDGSRVGVSLSVSPVHDADGRVVGAASKAPWRVGPEEVVGVVGISHDTTERDALLARLQLQFGRMPLACVQFDADLRVTDWNPAADRIFGFPRDEVLGMGPPYEKIVPMTFWAEAEPLLARIKAGDMAAHSVNQNLTKDGRTITCEWFNTPLLDEGGRFTGLLCLAQDLTARLLLEEQFRQAQKMDAFGQLAGGVAHDFNNLLTIINGYSDIVLDSLPPGDPNRELLAEVHKAGERSAGLTRQLLAFSRQQVLALRVLDLNVVVGDTASMLRRVIGEDVKLSTTTANGLWPVKADPGQVEQILLNLAVNARDAMPTGGKLTIETCNVELDETYLASHPDARAGSHVLLAVSDTGCGMSAAVRAKIFEPFFTTKGPGKGTGLGLATVYGIVKQSGGHVGVYSEVGVGTTFKVYLPRTEQGAGESRSPSGLRTPPRGTETVLVVEDDAAVRGLTRHILQLAGYAVLEAAGGDEALLVATGHTGRIHLLVTDVVMPGLGGRAAAERLAERRPGLRVLFVSGYTDDAVVRHGVLHDKVNFLQKPFTPAALAWKVREVLDQPST
jgi:PAS domain S-box-containing protein